MSRQLFLIALLSVASHSVAPLHAQDISWENTGGLIGATVTSLLTGPGDQVFAGTISGKLLRSADRGTTWKEWGSGLPGRGKPVGRLLRYGGDTLFAGIWNGGIVRSTDNGASWASIGVGYPSSGFTMALRVDARRRIWAVEQESGIYRSSNGGQNWTKLFTVPQGFSSAMDDMVITAQGTIFAATSDSGIYRSTDDGVTWKQANTGVTQSFLNVTSLAINSRGIILAGGSGEIVYRSTNNGTNWTPATVKINGAGNVYVLTTNSAGDIFAVSEMGHGVYRSTDDGKSWTRTSNETWSTINALAMNASGDLFAATFYSGIHRSSNSGAAWQVLDIGLIDPLIWTLSIGAKGKVLAGTQGAGVHRLNDNGTGWKPLGLNGPNITAVMETPSGELFASAFGSFGDRVGLFRSTDDGKTWNSSKGVAGIEVSSFQVVAPRTIFVGATGVHRSTDDGATWMEVGVGTLPKAAHVISIVRNPAGTLFARLDTLGVYRSTDNGTTWKQAMNGLTTQDLNDLVVDKDGDLLALAYNRVFRSTNAGDLWVQVGDTLPGDIYTSEFAIDSSGTIFIAAVDRLFKGNKRKGEWRLITTGIAGLDVFELAIAPGNYLYLATGDSGIYRSLKPTTSDVPSIDLQPLERLQLVRVTPNPVGDAARLEFDLPRSAAVNLRLFDSRGSEVLHVTPGVLEAGRQTLEWSVDGLPAGLYLYRLDAGEMVARGSVVVGH